MNGARPFYEEHYAGANADIDALLRGMAGARPGNRNEVVAGFVADGARVLDVGCGRGHLLHLVRGRIACGVGVDVVRDQLLDVRSWVSRVGAPVSVAVVDVSGGLPFGDASFDAVVASALLELVFDPLAVLEELRRVAVPGGRVAVTVGNIASVPNRARLLVGRTPWTTRFAGAVNGGALHYFTLRSLSELVIAAGLQVESCTCSGRWRALRRLRPSLLGSDLVVVARRP